MSTHNYDATELQALRVANESLRQQLAAALAACKLKHGALMKLAEHDGKCDVLDLDEGGCHKPCSCGLTDALATQPDDSALKAWIGEPVARTLKRVGKEQYQPEFGIVARTYAELPKGSYPDTWEELDELYSPKGLK